VGSRNRKDLNGHFKLTILLALFLVATYLNVEFILPDTYAKAQESSEERILEYSEMEDFYNGGGYI
jgi:hypothetical protein